MTPKSPSPRKRGPKPNPEGYLRVLVRLTPTQKAAIKRAAGSEGVGPYLRRVGLEAATTNAAERGTEIDHD